MAEAPATDTIGAELTVPERVVWFCLPSDTDWVEAGVPTLKIRTMNLY
jgi:hypothetical protein